MTKVPKRAKKTGRNREQPPEEDRRTGLLDVENLDRHLFVRSRILDTRPSRGEKILIREKVRAESLESREETMKRVWDAAGEEGGEPGQHHDDLHPDGDDKEHNHERDAQHASKEH